MTSDLSHEESESFLLWDLSLLARTPLNAQRPTGRHRRVGRTQWWPLARQTVFVLGSLVSRSTVHSVVTKKSFIVKTELKRKLIKTSICTIYTVPPSFYFKREEECQIIGFWGISETAHQVYPRSLQSRRKSDCFNGFRWIFFLISVYNSMFGILNVTDRILLTSKLCWKICLKVLIMAIFMLIYLHKIKWLLDRTSSEPRQRELEINLTFLVWARARLAHY